MLDSTNQYHGYSTGTDQLNENTQMDFSLIPRINLEYPIIDPDYTIIPTITTLRDLWWYMARVQGDWNNLSEGGDIRLWPIKLFIDSSNSPLEWDTEIKSVIQYFQDSVEIHPDSLILENPVFTEPASANGYSSYNIIYTDSIPYGSNLSSTIEFWFSARIEKFVGGYMWLDTTRITNKIDAGKHIARLIEMYVCGVGVHDINNIEYLSYTNGTRNGPRRRPNSDEINMIRVGRNSTYFYINRIFP